MEEKKTTFHHSKRLKVNHIKEIQKKKIPGENKKENRLSIRYKVKTLSN